jgi:hypothetical protein
MRSALVAMAATGCVTALHVTTPSPGAIDTAPFTLPAQDGRSVSLAAELAHGPVVLVFYRGFW